MINKNITLKDLMSSYRADTFHECFGLTDERGLEIVIMVEHIIQEVHKLPTWSPAKLLRKIADAEITDNYRETAFVVFLVGCHVGEDSVYQTVISEALLKNAIPKKKGDGDDYVN